MKIALMHYHLKNGGVRTVLNHQVAALDGVCETLLVTGQEEGIGPDDNVVIVKGLGYDEPGVEFDPEAVADGVCRAIESCWPGGCDLLHVHNATLMKNKNFLKILKHLQKKGVTLLLQLHDFAEDGRPHGYYANEQYPENCHYSVINSRDSGILLDSGLAEPGLHLISNTINSFGFEADDEKSEDFTLYPVRAIRRKNIGEAVLLSHFLEPGKRLLITQPPNSPADYGSYGFWKELVARTNLAVEFESGQKKDFVDLVKRADNIVTTSITEGFGFTFLEPWTAGKFIWGRKLPDICIDFENNGMDFNHLYTKLSIPVDWIGKQAFKDTWITCVQSAFATFNSTPDMDAVDAAYERVVADDLIDFGLLNEKFQEKTLLNALDDRETLIQFNPFLANPGRVQDKKTLIQKNRNVIAEKYTLKSYRDVLQKIYARVVESSPAHRIDKRRLLTRFLDLDSFSLLKWDTFEE